MSYEYCEKLCREARKDEAYNQLNLDRSGKKTKELTVFAMKTNQKSKSE